MGRRKSRRKVVNTPASNMDAGVKSGPDYLSVVALIATFFPIAIAAFRILDLAQWDYLIVPVVLKSASFGAVAMSVFISAYPILAVFGIVAIVIMFRSGGLSRRFGVGLLSALAGVSVFFAPVLTWLVIAIACWTAKSELAWPPREYSKWVRISHTFFGILYLSFFVMELQASSRYWIPSELIEKKEGSSVAVYVIESGDHDLVAVPVGPKDPIIIRQDDIEKRTFCEVRPRSAVKRILTSPLPVLINWDVASGMPSCDVASS